MLNLLIIIQLIALNNCLKLEKWHEQIKEPLQEIINFMITKVSEKSKCMVYIFDSFYENLIHHNENRILMLPYYNCIISNVYETVLNSINQKAGQVLFLDAPGRTGKTFLLNSLLAKVRADNNIALAVASSGIAATLLFGEKTAHSLFKLPLDLNRDKFPICNVSKQSELAKVFKECDIIVWDEIYTVFVRENEEFSPPQPTIQAVLTDSKNSGCDSYIILITNGFQTMDLLQYAERERLLNIQSVFLLMYDSRLFYSNMKYLWNRIINVVFIRRYNLIRSQSGKKISYDWFNLETMQYPISDQHLLRTYYIDTWYKRRFHYNKTHFASKVLDLSRKKLKVAIFEHIPAVTMNSRMFYKNYTKHSNKSLGIEFEIMKIIANKINFEPIFYRPQNVEVTRWGSSHNNGTHDGLLGEAVEAKASFFLGDLHYTLRHYEILDLSFPYNTECLTFLTPESFTDNSWKLLINPFTLYAWITIIFVLLFVAYTLQGFTMFYRKQILLNTRSTSPSILKVISITKQQEVNRIYSKKFCGLSPFIGVQNCLLYTYSMLLQVSLPRIPEVWALRVFIGWWWLYTILITVTYRASLTANLANPIARITINTITDLAKSSLPIGGWDENYKDVFSSESDVMLNKIGENFELTNDEDEAIARVAEGTFAYYENIYILKDARAKRQLLESIQKNEALKNSKNLVADRNLHVMEECIVHMPISIGMIKNSPLKLQVDLIINKIVESGLVKKWLSDVMEWSQIVEIKSESNEPKALIDIRKLYGIFVALIIGYFLGIIALIAENLHWRLVTTRNPKYDKYRMDVFYSYMTK